MMTLQDKMKMKIDDFCGIKSLVEFLEKFSNTINDSDRIYFNNMIDYFSLLFIQVVPVEEHAVKYREASLKTISVLEFYNKDGRIEKMNFLKDLISFKLEAVSNIKGLAS